MLKCICLFLFLSATLWSQQAGPYDDDLPLAPLRGSGSEFPRPSPAKRPDLSGRSAGSLGDVSTVVPTKCIKPKGKFPWNLERAKLSDLVDQISRLMCRNFIIGSGIKPSQEISIISRTPITLEQAWQAFESTLEANELSLFKTGDYYKIIKRGDSNKQPVPVLNEKAELPRDEGMVTFLYDLKHIPKDVAQSLVKGLISRLGDLIVVGETFLVITDGSSNIRRIMDILGKVDIAGASNRIHIVDLIHADATQIQNKLNDIFVSLSGKPEAKAPSRSPYEDYLASRGAADNFSLKKIIADERTNKLIIIASNKAFVQIKEMIDVLDVPTSGAGTQSQIYVYYLKNGDAKKISTTLSTLVQGMRSGQRASVGTPNGFARDAMFESEIKVTADEATNSLVVAASPRDYKALTLVIAKLDKKRTQVFVEAAIMEISLDDTNNFSLGAFGGIPFQIAGNNSTFILANPAGKSLATDVFTKIGAAIATNNVNGVAAAGLAPFLNTMGFIGPTQDLSLNGNNLKVPGIGAILDIMQQYSNVDVLSTPSLMTMDNEKAEMSVGQRVPTVSGMSTVGFGTGQGGLGIPMQNVTYQEPKLKFTITPHVNDDNNVRLEIEQDVSTIGNAIELGGIKGNTQYTFNTKTTKTVVTSQDQQTIVLGGLVDETYRTIESKIPWLGDIPVLGHLFKNTRKEKVKKNLMLVLTPYVVRDENDLQRIYQRKVQEREEFSKLYFGDKITKFDPYIDYDKKTGPVAHLIHQVSFEMEKTENGGKGLPDETVFKPVHDDWERHKFQTLDPSSSEQSILESGAAPVQVPPSMLTESEPASVKVEQ
ncbi:MAG: type II secretion system secretin GspD [Myxococcaceae bacterium]|nr:type II secretion system secretin GspD [Myxococcaceae bacterium]MBH2006489.1 type II secretion system secretin GspD [Myxococcaceae bacterium]